MTASKPLILFIDAYDSFSSNIVSLLETHLAVSIRTVKIDDPVLLSADNDALLIELRHYAAVVCGPGPGSPGIDADVGIMKRIWKLADEELLPVLGICMGFQSLCLEFGAEVKRLQAPQHGIVRRVEHVGTFSSEHGRSIFTDVGEVSATLYQSLGADIGQYLVPDQNWDQQRWLPTQKCADLVPLAWVDGKKYDMEDYRILLAVRHRAKPFFGLQYHPESICSNDGAIRVICNWFEEARVWNKTRGRTLISSDGPVRGRFVTRDSLLSQFKCGGFLNHTNGGSNDTHNTNGRSHLHELGSSSNIDLLNNDVESIYLCKTVPLGKNVSVPHIAESVDPTSQDKIVLESTNAYQTSVGTQDVKGRHSIIAVDVSHSVTFEYSVTRNKVVVSVPPCKERPSSVRQALPVSSSGGVWPLLADFLHKRQITHGNPESPFWGGFMGYTTYELGLQGIDVETGIKNPGASESRPDLCFAWVTKSVVVDHVKGCIYIQELVNQREQNLMANSTSWMNSVAAKLEKLSKTPEQVYPDGFAHDCSGVKSSKLDLPRTVISVHLPGDAEYETKVRQCQSYIRSGDSYELCLTDQTIVKRIKPYSAKEHLSNGSSSIRNGSIREGIDESWTLYKALRKRQPAPFASYIRLGHATLVSSSPERFLKWDANGRCELRPMKGTVRKSSSVATLEQASALLQIPKEQAENLMIVDLVRHDLHGVCGSGNVSVPRLMVVEEYASVFQMISVVIGQIPQALSASEKDKPYTGLDVLAASLPPGSMTGAPKKRSCEILQEIENGMPRSLYSGVVGYMDVGGRGDFSVTIRCMFRWDDEDEDLLGPVNERSAGERSVRTEAWHIGAGGAVTSLSTPEGEREEMLTKLNGTLGIFLAT